MSYDKTTEAEAAAEGTPEDQTSTTVSPAGDGRDDDGEDFDPGFDFPDPAAVEQPPPQP